MSRPRLTAAVRVRAETDSSSGAANEYSSHNAAGELTVTSAAVVMTIHASFAKPAADAPELRRPKSLSEMALPGEGSAEPALLGPAMRALMLDESRTDMSSEDIEFLPCERCGMRGRDDLVPSRCDCTLTDIPRSRETDRDER